MVSMHVSRVPLQYIYVQYFTDMRKACIFELVYACVLSVYVKLGTQVNLLPAL